VNPNLEATAIAFEKPQQLADDKVLSKPRKASKDSYATAVASISTRSSGKAKLATPKNVDEGRYPDSARWLATASYASKKWSTAVV
jgi:hypothetical protein